MTVEEAIEIVIGAMRDPFSSVYTPAVGALQFLDKEARLAAKYRTALELYADEGNYNVSSAPVIQHLHYESADKGDKAREVLKQ